MRIDTFISAISYVLSTSTASLILLRAQRIVDDGATSFAQFEPLTGIFLVAITVAALHVMADLSIMRRQTAQTRQSAGLPAL
jgi:hypothetical protein